MKKRTITIRGVEVELGAHAGLAALGFALLALEDPRVDAVLAACDVVFFDAHGRQVWPREEG